MHTVFHFFHSALLVLVFLVRGRLLWLHSSGQEINVGLLVHLSSARPSRNVCVSATRRPPSSSDAQVVSPAAFQPVASPPGAARWRRESQHRRWVILTLPHQGRLGEKGSFLELPNREKLWFHGVDYFSSQSLKDKAQGRRDCSPFRGATKGLLS